MLFGGIVVFASRVLQLLFLPLIIIIVSSLRRIAEFGMNESNDLTYAVRTEVSLPQIARFLVIAWQSHDQIMTRGRLFEVNESG